MTKTKMYVAGVFHEIPRMDDSRLAEIFAREVLAMLVRKELLSPEWAERILSWRHTGFNVHSLVRAKTKPEAERVGKYMIRPILALERLFFLEQEGKVGYRHGENGEEQGTTDYLEFIARVTSHIPDKGQVAAIDMAARPALYFRCGQEEGFIARSRQHETQINLFAFFRSLSIYYSSDLLRSGQDRLMECP